MLYTVASWLKLCFVSHLLLIWTNDVICSNTYLKPTVFICLHAFINFDVMSGVHSLVDVCGKSGWNDLLISDQKFNLLAKDLWCGTMAVSLNPYVLYIFFFLWVPVLCVNLNNSNFEIDLYEIDLICLLYHKIDMHLSEMWLQFSV